MTLRLVEKQVVYSGKKLRLEVHHLEDEHRTRKIREVAVHPGAVVILPILDESNILLIRNKRYAVGQTLLELPAGTLEADETPMNCAGRELQEETGHLAGRLSIIGSFYSSPGVLTEKMFAFAAHDLKKTAPALEDGEEIDVVPSTFDEALIAIRNGRIQDAKTIATLLMYDRFLRT